ncbi:MAG TPA: pre-peptidase C-terminal domain-containing protein, partial [Flavobacteriales bacterium]|nr:pre-peptidase C-terminal domain-containing protein [Flavobacteriales bacterium]
MLTKFTRTLFLITACLIFEKAVAQGTTCGTAVSLTVNGACAPATTITDATASGPAITCGTFAQEGWYSFTIAATTTITITATNTNRNLAIQLVSGTCPGSLAQVACENSLGGGAGTETLNAGSLAAGTYYIRILNVGAGASMGMSSVCVTSVAAPANDDPCSATAVTVGASCTFTTYTNAAATASSGVPAPGCASYAGGDVWFTVTVPASGNLTFDSNTGVITDGGMALYTGTCSSLSLLACDDDASTNGLMPMLVQSGLTPGATIWIRFWEYNNDNSGTFSLCVYDGGGGAVNDNPCTATTLPVNSSCVYSSQTNTGATNTTSVPDPGCALYSGADVWFSVTVPASGMLEFDSNVGTITDGGMAVYSGSCASLTLLGCDDDGSVNGLMPAISLSGLTPGSTLWIRFWEFGGGAGGSFSICVYDPCPTMCSGSPTGGSSSASPSTTNCASTSTTLTVTGASSGCGITYQWQSSPDGIVWTNIAGATATTCATTAAATTYFQCLVICSASGLTTPSTTTVVTFSGTAPANDLPCNATALTLGVTENGDNTCAGSASEPAAASCWTGGAVEAVWFTVVPTSTTLKIKTTLGTLTNTQIAVYTGTCSSLTFLAGSCNNDAPACGSSTVSYSELSLTGLTAGTTYYIRVDGTNGLEGTFDILAIDGASSFPTVAGMDCVAPNPVCLSTFVVADPGYSGYGSVCDLPSSYCLASAERNIVWYTIPINAAGNLVFDIVPNDFDPVLETETDYDFGIWKIGGTGSVTCAQIAAGTATPLRCNYSGLGVTGLNGTTAGNAPASLSAAICPTCGAYSPSPTYNGAYEARIAVASGETYLLAISNFSNSTSGFGIDFKTSPIGYTGTTATSVTWTGGTSTAWNLNSNWGGCNYPTCSIDAIIVPLGTQPVVTGTMSVKDLIINPGATLTLSAGSTLIVCGSVTNNGNIVASPTSTILFNDNLTTHQMTGAFTGGDKLGNLTVTDVAGGTNCTVTLNNDLEMGGNFTTTNATSIFNTNGKYVTLAGNFVNNNGATTYTNVGTSGTLEFNGTAAQTYTQGSSLLDLNFVLMNHTGPGVTLLSDMNIKTVTGTLTLTLGKIITTTTYQVYVKNKTTTACNAGNTNSFVQGYLRRGITGTGVFEFPVGESVKGYQRATINFTTASTTIDNIRADFVQYGSTPAALGVTDCTVPYNLPFLDNGKWNLNAYNSTMTQITGNGVYNCTLWPRAGSYTNHTSAIEWTVAKDPGSGWSIVGTCNLASVVNQVMRDAMTGFSAFGVEQSTTTLPVELISFTGENSHGDHLLKWL